MGENKMKNDEGKKNADGGVTVVLKTDLHCEGCASKVIKCIRSFDGVDTVTAGGQQITVVGTVDPAKLREKVEQKMHKKVELISPEPMKDGGGEKKENGKGKENTGKQEKKIEPKDKPDSKGKPEKETPITAAVFKVALHCDGCIQKIHKTVTKTKGYTDMKIDKQKDLVTVTGAVDMKALAEVLSKQLKRDVQIVPAAKGGGGEKKEKDGGGEKEKEGGGKSKGEERKEGSNAVQTNPYSYPYPYPSMPGAVTGEQINYNPYPVFSNHAPQIFSDENPNACRVM